MRAIKTIHSWKFCERRLPQSPFFHFSELACCDVALQATMRVSKETHKGMMNFFQDVVWYFPFFCICTRILHAVIGCWYDLESNTYVEVMRERINLEDPRWGFFYLRWGKSLTLGKTPHDLHIGHWSWQSLMSLPFHTTVYHQFFEVVLLSSCDWTWEDQILSHFALSRQKSLELYIEPTFFIFW